MIPTGHKQKLECFKKIWSILFLKKGKNTHHSLWLSSQLNKEKLAPLCHSSPYYLQICCRGGWRELDEKEKNDERQRRGGYFHLFQKIKTKIVENFNFFLKKDSIASNCKTFALDCMTFFTVSRNINILKVKNYLAINQIFETKEEFFKISEGHGYDSALDPISSLTGPHISVCWVGPWDHLMRHIRPGRPSKSPQNESLFFPTMLEV